MQSLNTVCLAHDFLRRMIGPGALCIDATAGRGRDTEFLCELVGQNGRVIAFDIQQDAVGQTQRRLDERGICQARVILDSHVNMERYAEPESVDAVVFNFGRLPGGDPNLFTKASSSVPALEAALRLLKPGGVMSLSIYYGGPNGYDERDAILHFLKGLDNKGATVLAGNWLNRPNEPPIPVFVWKHRA